VGAVDCGTNSIRLLVADLDGDVKTDVHREMRVVRLGQGVDRTGELAPEALERTRLALVDHAATLRDLGAERVRMVATSATRDARNRDAFTALVVDVLGVPPEVVSGDEEAALSFDGATRGLDPAAGPVPGHGHRRRLHRARARDRVPRRRAVGRRRLRPPDRAAPGGRPADTGAGRGRHGRRRRGPRPRPRRGAGRASPHRRRAGRIGHDRGRGGAGARGVRPRAHPPVADLRGRRRRRRDAAARHEPCGAGGAAVMHPGRVDVIGAGALVLATLVDRLGLPEVVVSEADILDGIAWSLA
jgi:exopolyphosphatase/guanosine-5'-triphosphate,3'-diphosphate pyrophosphatase